jgi:prevent-host-death family protein
MPNTVRKSQPATPELSLAVAKATLSAVVDSVKQRRVPVTILRRGVPVAQIVPFPGTPMPSLRGSMKGSGREIGDIVSPLGIEWTVNDE